MRVNRAKSDEFDGNQADESIDDAGYVPDANLPGDSQGETNGLYAGVTENQVDGDGYDYFEVNPGGRTDLLSQINDLITGGSRAVSNIQNAAGRVRANQARNNWQSTHGYKPTLGEQWGALDTFSKFGFVAALLGILWAFKKA